MFVVIVIEISSTISNPIQQEKIVKSQPILPKESLIQEKEVSLPTSVSPPEVKELPIQSIVQTTITEKTSIPENKPIIKEIPKTNSADYQSIIEARCKRFGIPYKPSSTNHLIKEKSTQNEVYNWLYIIE